MTAVLDIDDLHVTMPLAAGDLHAVRGVSFSVARGETLCIVGESGCGKSLTSLAIMDLLPARARRRAGRLRFDGRDLAGLTEREMADIRGNRMAMIFQEPMTSLNPAYTIGNQLCEALLQHRRISRAEARGRAAFLLGKVGITSPEERLRQYPHQLSGGLRQRVMIALALMCDPALIIADEPTTALDVTVQAQILHLLASLQREFGLSLVLITHDLGVVARIADRVAVMYAGQIVEYGATADVFAHPRHPYTQGLMRCIPVPGRTRRDQPLGSIAGIVPALIGRQTGCGFASRCEFVQDICRAGDISLTPARETHHVRCLFPLGEAMPAQSAGAFS